MANENLCVTTNWAGAMPSLSRAPRRRGWNVPLRYDVPATGDDVGGYLRDPHGRANAENAHIFLDYMMRPEVIAAATNYTAYANANKDANALVDPSILSNPAIYPDDTVKARIWLPEAVSVDYDSARTRACRRS